MHLVLLFVFREHLLGKKKTLNIVQLILSLVLLLIRESPDISSAVHNQI